MHTFFFLAHCGVLLVTSFLLSSCQQIESPEKLFLDSKAAIKSGMTGEGKWIPQALLLNSASNIHLKYDIDTNEIWVSFSFDGIEKLTFLDQCSENKIIPPRYSRVMKISWWPQNLFTKEGEANTECYNYYNCSDVLGGMVAIPSSSRNLHYWTTGN